MTKKRFVKLLMSKGIQRNEAQKIAALYNSRNISYSTAYKLYVLSSSVKNSVAILLGAIENFSAAIKQTKDSLCTLAEQVANTFRDYYDNYSELAKLAEFENYAFYRKPFPKPPKDIHIKSFILDRRTAINKIKKKKGTVY